MAQRPRRLGQMPERRAAAAHLAVFALLHHGLAAVVAHADAAIAHARIQAVLRRALGVGFVAAVVSAIAGVVLGAAHADGGHWGLQPGGVVTGLAKDRKS